ncbi:spore germination protein [Paenibacillus oceani]|uniref:Spore germination protein n=1 Tax=Paenibacillus oceani TaxID=2772510 RepID=A0A927CE01_9BACL|nr:spore germination protein [Paenibacillus oceani]MBD2866323.1 spore germination protein [Paenibacillus oceani]
MKPIPEEIALYADLDAVLRDGGLTIAQLKDAFARYADLRFPASEQFDSNEKLTAVYCDGMIDKFQLNKYLAKMCRFVAHLPSSSQSTHLEYSDELPLFEIKHTIDDMLTELFTGSLIIYREGDAFFWTADISDVPQRSLQESNTEISIKGPKDAFTEDLFTNISLIRKRMQTGLLFSEQFFIGNLSKTCVVLLYLSHKANPDMVAEARRRLSSFRTESIISSGQLEKWLSDRTFSLFPLIDYIGRPDFVNETLLRGRLAIVVDGSPMVLIGPSNFLELLKTPEDVHFPYHYVMFQRALRILGLLLSIFLPGFWIAIATVNLDQIPFALLSTVVISREGIPLPTFLEALLLLFQFELLREAGIRLPKAVGQTIGIVGGLIIGDSLIRAGLASPTLLVVIAISAVATFTLVNQSLSGTVSLLRVFILIVSSFLGIYGFFLSMFTILIYLCRLDSFGLAFLEPIVSLRFKEWLDGFLINPFRRSRFSSAMINKRKGE